jgi:predicted RNA-binding protein with PUA-like domain
MPKSLDISKNKAPQSTGFWLMKTEPDVFSIHDLKKNKTTLWEGVRNYTARNYMMKDMEVGQNVLFYHSNAEPSGIAGLAKVSKKAIPDPLQFDKKSEYFDPKATKEKPIWFCVEVEFEKIFKNVLSLAELKTIPELCDMLVIKKGQRLSIQPVSEKNFKFICRNYS